MRRPIPVLVLLLVAVAAPVHAGSSNSLLDVSPDGTRLLAVNADNGTVSIVDLKTRRVLHEIAVGDKPEGATWVGNGSLAAVTVYREDRVVFVDAAAGKVVDRLSVEDEPYGIVALKDGSRAYVTHEYPGSVSEIDLATRKVLRTFPVGAMVRGLALSPDEQRLYVTEFTTGVLHAVDRASGKVVDSWKGHSTDNLARHVVVHPTRPKAYLSHIRSKITVAHGSGSIFPQLSICDLVPPGPERRRSSIGMDTYNGVYVVTNPWEAALSPDGKRLYTLYAGTDDMNVSTVIDDNYREIRPEGGPRHLGKNPRAIRTSPDGEEVYIYNTLDFAVTVHDAGVRRTLATIPVCKPPKSPEWVRGKVLFASAERPYLTSARWIACASCHPDGHSDGRVWKNPEGLRKTPPMMGLAHTHPLHWSADRDEVQDFEYTLRGRLMGGYGLIAGRIKPKVGHHPVELEEKTSGRSKDLDAMAIYCNSFTFTLSPHIPAPGKLFPAAERGRALFFDKTVGCAVCHSGPYYSDSRLQKPFNLHDVGTGGDDPGEKMGPKYDTPTLLGVYRSAPYLHTGKAKTLRDVLTTCNAGDKHGKTSHLTPEQVDDLVAFLKSLPYELPPDETPNTVPYRYVAPRKKD
ncbi:MAG: c-type cytochrome [Gemmataceae bacterium]